MIYILFIICFGLMLWALYFEKSVFGPAFLMTAAYSVSVLSALCHVKEWNLSISSETVMILIIGLVIFVGTSFLWRILSYKSKQRIEEKQLRINKMVVYKSRNLKMLVVLSCFISVLYILFYIKAVGGISLANFAQTIYATRMNNFLSDDYIGVPTVVNQLTKLLRASSYIGIYIYINNHLLGKKEKKLLLIPTLFYIPVILLSGGRFDLIVLFFYTLICFGILYQCINNTSINFKLIVKILFLVIIVLICFSNFKQFLGRKEAVSIVDDITKYFGGSIKCFDMYIKKHVLYKQETGSIFTLLTGVEKFLKQLHIININETGSFSEDFIQVGNIVIGNVYTGYRNYIETYGLMGVVISQMILASIVNTLYYKALRNYTTKFSWSCIIYATISFSIILHFFSEFFFGSVISLNFTLLFLCMYIVVYFLTKIKIKY